MDGTLYYTLDDATRKVTAADVKRVANAHLDTSRTSDWMGHRPCLPDSLPVIGPATGTDNAWFAFGHGHVGMCGGASTGREIANLVAGRTPQVDLKPFRADRF